MPNPSELERDDAVNIDGSIVYVLDPRGRELLQELLTFFTVRRSDSVEYTIIEDHNCPGAWRVEAVNHAGDGEVYTAVFYGPRSKERAEEYAAWKRAEALGEE